MLQTPTQDSAFAVVAAFCCLAVTLCFTRWVRLGEYAEAAHNARLYGTAQHLQALKRKYFLGFMIIAAPMLVALTSIRNITLLSPWISILLGATIVPFLAAFPFNCWWVQRWRRGGRVIPLAYDLKLPPAQAD